MPSHPPPLNTEFMYGHTPLPRQYSQPVTLAPLLQRVVGGTGIAWAVSECPSTAIATMLLRRGEVWGSLPATTPPMHTLTIWPSQTRDRPIVVRPKTIAHTFVTIEDVLCAVYYHIRAAAQEAFYPSYPPPAPSRYPSLLQPTPMRPALNEMQVRELVGRYLNGRCRWDGLSPSPCEAEAWELYIR